MKTEQEIRKNLKSIEKILREWRQLGWSTPRIRLTGKVFKGDMTDDDFPLIGNTQLKMNGEHKLHTVIKILNWVLDKKHYSF